jgi:hypothetical protein
MSFTADVHKIAKKIGVNVEDLAAATFIEVFSGVIRATPVDTGRARGNWQTTKNSPASGTTERIQKNKNAGVATSEAHAVVNKPGLYYLTNNLPYAEKLEFGGYGTGPSSTSKTKGGFSIQAPLGMVRINAKRIKQILRKEARKLSR